MPVNFSSAEQNFPKRDAHAVFLEKFSTLNQDTLDSLKVIDPRVDAALNLNDRLFNNKFRRYAEEPNAPYTDHPKIILTAMIEDKIIQGNEFEKILIVLFHDNIEEIGRSAFIEMLDNTFDPNSYDRESVIQGIDKLTNPKKKTKRIGKDREMTMKMRRLDPFSIWIKLYDRGHNTSDFAHENAPITWVTKYTKETITTFENLKRLNKSIPLEEPPIIEKEQIEMMSNIYKQMAIGIREKITKLQSRLDINSSTDQIIPTKKDLKTFNKDYSYPDPYSPSTETEEIYRKQQKEWLSEKIEELNNLALRFEKEEQLMSA